MPDSASDKNDLQVISLMNETEETPRNKKVSDKTQKETPLKMIAMLTNRNLKK